MWGHVCVVIDNTGTILDSANMMKIKLYRMNDSESKGDKAPILSCLIYRNAGSSSCLLPRNCFKNYFNYLYDSIHSSVVAVLKSIRPENTINKRYD